MTDRDYELGILRARIAALEDVVAALLRRFGAPERLVGDFRRTREVASDYFIRGNANTIVRWAGEKAGEKAAENPRENPGENHSERARRTCLSEAPPGKARDR